MVTHTHTYIHTHIYIYTYTYTHTHTHIHIHTHKRNIWPSATPTANQYKHMAERHIIETYGRGSYNRNIWPYNSQAPPSRLADSFVLHAAFYPLLSFHTFRLIRPD